MERAHYHVGLMVEQTRWSGKTQISELDAAIASKNSLCGEWQKELTEWCARHAGAGTNTLNAKGKAQHGWASGSRHGVV